MADVDMNMSRRNCSIIYVCVILILLSVYYIPHVAAEGHCIWYGSCTLSNETKVKNCYYDGPAKPMEEETRHILRKYCPGLAAGGRVCCDSSQLKTLATQIGPAESLLGRYPTCFDNFIRHICFMTCAPDQSDFLNPVKRDPFNATHAQVKEIDYHLSYEYMETTFNSCSNVQVPSTNQVVFDLMCGDYGSNYCTPQRWFDFMGDASSPFVPFQVNYKSKVEPTDGYLPLNLTSRPSNVGENIPHVAAEGHCIWYGSCTLSNETKVKNCYYDGPAKPIEEETRHILRKYCPGLAAGGRVCCDSSQLKTLATQIGPAESLLGRYPTCFDNFIRHICFMTCAPDQSDFLNPVKRDPFNATHAQVKEIDYHLSYEYMETTFNSCCNVQVPSTNQVVFDLMCGDYGSNYCTPQRWFDFMGDASSPFVPFQVNYKSKVEPTDGYLPLNLTSRPCNVGENIPHVAAEGHCIWYGSCTLSNETKVKNCYYDGPAKPIEEETRHILRKYCPGLAAGGKVCCDSSQLKTLATQIRPAESLLGRCPTCFDNFIRHICFMTCAPDQSDFLNPVKLDPFNATHAQVKEIDYHLSYEYMEASFNSCSNVQVPSTNQVVFDFMCGDYGSSYCTPQRWFDFMGDASSPFVPFQVNYKSKQVEPTDGYLPLNLTSRPCNVGENVRAFTQTL